MVQCIVRIVGVVLAAGEGRRIGGPKALLRIGGESFLTRVATVLARPGVSEVVAVVGHEATRVVVEAAPPRALGIVENRAYREGMLGSILRGLQEAEQRGADAILLHPVDHPLVTSDTVDRVVAALVDGAIVAVPSHGGHRGHPGGFARPSFAELRAASPGRGARAVLADHPDWIVHVPGDPGCVAGIDTPDDYALLVVGAAG
jgi:CTP:molybdopterin cytidylyltransferase MocA